MFSRYLYLFSVLLSTSDSFRTGAPNCHVDEPKHRGPPLWKLFPAQVHILNDTIRIDRTSTHYFQTTDPPFAMSVHKRLDGSYEVDIGHEDAVEKFKGFRIIANVSAVGVEGGCI